MSKYKHKNKREYIIAEGEYYRVWNNGIVQECYDLNDWYERNNLQTWKERLQFLKLWETAVIGQKYHFNWSLSYQMIEISFDGAVTFLGFKEECPECKKSNLIWENKIQLCKGCDYIHAFMVDDDN